MQSIASPYVLVPGADGERAVPLAAGQVWRIGRSEGSDIVVADKRVSRDHALIERTDSGDYYLIDLGSRNGSFVNDKRVSVPVPLRNGDRLSIGGFVVVFRAPEVADEATLQKLRETEATQAWFVSRLLTVVVVDVRNFTHLTQSIPQDLLCQTIGTWFRYASEIMKPRGSWAIKYIGDAVMSIWLHEDPAAQAGRVLEAMWSVVELASATAGLQPKFGLPAAIRIGAGINTGMASVGNTGTRTFADYTALGDAVNSAFRMESATKDLGVDVVVGDGSFKGLPLHARPEAYFRRHEAWLKGYAAPVVVWSASIDALRSFLDEAALSSPTQAPR